MHIIMTGNGTSISEQIDLDAVMLPGGVKANALNRDELHARLSAMHVPGITAHDGKMSMICAYERHRRASA